MVWGRTAVRSVATAVGRAAGLLTMGKWRAVPSNRFQTCMRSGQAQKLCGEGDAQPNKLKGNDAQGAHRTASQWFALTCCRPACCSTELNGLITYCCRPLSLYAKCSSAVVPNSPPPAATGRLGIASRAVPPAWAGPLAEE